MIIKIQCAHLKFKTCLVKYFKHFPVHVDPSVSLPQPASFLESDMLNTSPLWRSSCQRAAWSPGSLSCSWNIIIFVGTWDARSTMQGSAGLCFSKKNPREAVIVHGEKKKQKATTYSIDGSMATAFLRALGVYRVFSFDGWYLTQYPHQTIFFKSHKTISKQKKNGVKAED